MPCQHLTQIQQLNLPISDSDVLKIICPVCGNVEVCAYTPLETDEPENALPEQTSSPAPLSPQVGE